MSKTSQNRVCGILFCYNEEQVLDETIRFYLRQGIDLVMVDNCSTDSSPAIAAGYIERAGEHPGRLLEVVSVATDGYEWGRILKTACDYMHTRLSGYRWIALIDADAYYYSPVRGMGLTEFIEAAGRSGCNIIGGELFEFYPTEKDDPAVASHLERIRYCRVDPWDQRVVQQKIFRYHPSIDFYSNLGHTCLRDEPRLCEVKFLYHHYPWVNYEHGLKKIFNERKPRYVERQENPALHIHYMDLLPIEKDLVRDPAELTLYDHDGFLISPESFRKTIARARARQAKRRLKAVARRIIGPRRSAGGEAGAESCPAPALQTISGEEVMEQKAYVVGLPHTYHFLMTNFCNARCLFCNQDIERGQRQEIDLERFKAMTANIPMETAKIFYLSGGGDPLLARDFFPIVRHINENFPWIEVRVRTNGLLIGKYAEELAACDIRLEISVHGASGETNRRILQKQGEPEIFEGVARLSAQLEAAGKKMFRLFVPAVSRLNIEEVPEMIKKAAELGVDEVEIYFCRVYPADGSTFGGVREEDSLYYHQQLYDDVVCASVPLAEELGVGFRYEPLFSGEFTAHTCHDPWTTMVVDTNGDIYPCCGGEVWFRDRVRSGEYRFGNLLEEPVLEMVNNDTYVKLRRTVSPRYSDCLIPECVECHNLLAFRGPGEKKGHMVRAVGSSSGAGKPAPVTEG